MYNRPLRDFVEAIHMVQSLPGDKSVRLRVYDGGTAVILIAEERILRQTIE